MLLVVYDIHSDKIRTKLAKFLERYGQRIQYSVFELKNSPRIIENIKTELKNKFEKHFTQGESVLIYHIPDNTEITRFGYPVNEESDLVIML